jgi:type IV pilus assembly protein PilM
VITGVELESRRLRAVAVDAPTRGTVLAETTRAVPSGVLRHGEVLDQDQLTATLRELRRDRRFGKRIHLALASPRSVVRIVALPPMPPGEITAAVRLQLEDLVGMAAADSLVSTAPLPADGFGADGGEGQPVVVTAIARAVADPAVAAARAAGFEVVGVDLTPLALVRSLDRGDDAHAAVLVSIGADTTIITVHDRGIPRMIRTIGVGGDDLVAALARAAERPAQEAEWALRRSIEAPDAPESRAWAQRLEPVLERGCDHIAAEVRASVQYYLRQTGARTIGGLLLTGAFSSTLLATRLEDVLGVAVTRGGLTSAVDDELAAAYGAARAGAGPLSGLVLGGRDAAPRRALPVQRILVGVGAVAWAGALAALTVVHERPSRSSVEESPGIRAGEVTDDAGVAALGPTTASTAVTEVVDAPGATLDWTALLTDLAGSAPRAISFTALRIAPATAAPAAPAAPDAAADPGADAAADPGAGLASGADDTTGSLPDDATGSRLAIEATSTDFGAVADWLEALEVVAGIADVRLGPIARGSEDGLLTFSVTARVDPAGAA